MQDKTATNVAETITAFLIILPSGLIPETIKLNKNNNQ
jgi:hypothetical protein